MKKLLIFLALVIYFSGIYYLTRPSPELPALANTVRSDEPGDTWQHPDQAAYYTSRDSRPEILGELQRKFDLSSLFQFTYRLNYRPEESFEMVRDQLRAYYLEEVVHPLRESLFINVWDPAKSPMIDDDKRAQARMYFQGQFYPLKITLRPVYSGVTARLLIWTLIFPSTYAVYLTLSKSLGKEV